MELTSTRNPLLQEIRRAAAAGRPTEQGLIIAEGPHLLEEAKRGTWAIERVLVSPASRERYGELIESTRAEIIEVPQRVLTAIAGTGTPQNVLALLRPRVWSWADLDRDMPLLVVLDRIQDPGNAGTIVRSAEAFGATGIVLLQGCARVANGKLLRATAGSIFRTPFMQDVDESDLIKKVKTGGLRLYALAAQAERPVADADLRQPCALLAGSEGSGISPGLLARAEGLAIPTAGVESLNAAIACSIALYEARRQRCAP